MKTGPCGGRFRRSSCKLLPDAKNVSSRGEEVVILSKAKDLWSSREVHRSFASLRMTRDGRYTTSIFALARNCLARFERSFSYLLFCKSVFSSLLTSDSGFLRAGVWAFSRMMV